VFATVDVKFFWLFLKINPIIYSPLLHSYSPPPPTRTTTRHIKSSAVVDISISCQINQLDSLNEIKSDKGGKIIGEGKKEEGISRGIELLLRTPVATAKPLTTFTSDYFQIYDLSDSRDQLFSPRIFPSACKIRRVTPDCNISTIEWEFKSLSIALPFRSSIGGNVISISTQELIHQVHKPMIGKKRLR